VGSEYGGDDSARRHEEAMRTPQIHTGELRHFGLIRLAVASVIAVLLLGACGTASSKGASRTSPARKASEAPSTVAVTIKTFMFQPDPLQIKAGTSVSWTNQDEIGHTVTSAVRTYDAQGLTEGITKTGQFDMKVDGKGSTATFLFKEPGTVRYLCTIHPGMDAEVVVS
jgi:plastocyanin